MRSILIAALILAFAAPFSSQGFNKVLAAYKSGYYATALKEWKALAELSEPVAQFNLGFMY